MIRVANTYMSLPLSSSWFYSSSSFFVRLSSDVNAGDKFTAVYVLRGLSLGRTDLLATATQQDRKRTLTSNSKKIQVSFILCVIE
jgi:hypothetical protein